MKILKNNIKNAIKLTCTCCGSDLLVNKNDFVKYNDSDFAYFTCPVCNEHNTYRTYELKREGIFLEEIFLKEEQNDN